MYTSYVVTFPMLPIRLAEFSKIRSLHKPFCTSLLCWPENPVNNYCNALVYARKDIVNWWQMLLVSFTMKLVDLKYLYPSFPLKPVTLIENAYERFIFYVYQVIIALNVLFDLWKCSLRALIRTYSSGDRLK